MILYIIKWTLLYSILIFLMHNLYLFFKSNLTNTKIKDYYNTFSIEKDNTNNTNTNLLYDEINISSTSLDALANNINDTNMKDELTDFLQKIKL
uniref:Uncharacterized protein n=1 Tax=viral metagenome TaxID=1070528 RepID=A0A6C0CDK3_9ZZZZ